MSQNLQALTASDGREMVKKEKRIALSAIAQILVVGNSDVKVLKWPRCPS